MISGCAKTFAGHVVVWVHPDGIASLRGQDGNLTPAAQKIIDADAVLVNGRLVKASYRVRPGDLVMLEKRRRDDLDGTLGVA